MSATALDQAIAQAGSGAMLAKIVGITPMAISHWKVRGIPAHHVLSIEAATGISRHALRPDLYPEHRPMLVDSVPTDSHQSQPNESAVSTSSTASGAV
ncbi:Rha family transcriptional regulator [Pseudomonas tructae]|uniref:Rha family transcriptional regulator n=1 Tax=Pseudomonas tructae TaxID=2518644 RepID=A0A411MKZ7_9PSED|nr:YdaS family helix-turn-helix protein [Pseudomonas tructae]QBF27479.1 Rha family transcriptional regulator [Pseudomonas tructae]